MSKTLWTIKSYIYLNKILWTCKMHLHKHWHHETDSVSSKLYHTNHSVENWLENLKVNLTSGWQNNAVLCLMPQSALESVVFASLPQLDVELSCLCRLPTVDWPEYNTVKLYILLNNLSIFYKRMIKNRKKLCTSTENKWKILQ